MAVCFAVLSMITGLAACGGGGNNPSPVSTNSASQIYASASPALIASGETSIITWFSIDKITTCTASPTTKIGSSTGDNTISGSFTTVPLTTTTEFSITCGETTRRIFVSVPPAAINTAIHIATACSAYPPLTGTGSKTYYYCDCGSGANANCVPGVDGLFNDGTDPLQPRRTIEDAKTLFRNINANDTVALCQGGAFNSRTGFFIGTSKCGGPGSACNDLKDYRPAWLTGTAKPIINSAAGSSPLFTITNGGGGIRFLNLSLKGNGINDGYFIYNGAHDVTVCNADMDSFDLAITGQSGALGNPKNITITGSVITNTIRIGFLGGGDNFDLSYNVFEGNGSNIGRNHAIYPGSSIAPSSMRIIGNYVHGQYGTTCNGTLISSHGVFDSLLVKDNYVSIDAAAATGPCYGMGFNNNSNASNSIYFHNTVITGNTIINGGNIALHVASCPGCILENNTIIQNWSVGNYGIVVTPYPYNWYFANQGRVDDVNNANIIRNNTVWFGPNTGGSSSYPNTGIWTQTEGTGHIISNNTVTSEQPTGTLNCYRHDLPPGSIPPSYAFMDNNHCYSVSTYNFERTRGTLAAWQAYAGGLDANSIGGTPLFVNTANYNFKPNTGSPGSPLINAGSNANKSTLDILGITRPNPPAIGAYEP